jgi:hypothetical protein
MQKTDVFAFSALTLLELTWLRQIGLFLASAVYKTYLAPRANFSLPSQPRAAQCSHLPNLSIGAPSRVATPGLFFFKKRLDVKALKEPISFGKTWRI